MKEEIMKQLTPILENTKDSILKAADILKEQVPQVVNEIYCWEFVVSLIGFIIGIVLLIVTYLGIRAAIRYYKTNNECVGPEAMLFCFPIIIGIIFICDGISWIKILVAPKLFLIEYVSDLIK
jgi:hypothetical protein